MLIPNSAIRTKYLATTEKTKDNAPQITAPSSRLRASRGEHEPQKELIQMQVGTNAPQSKLKLQTGQS